MQKQYTYFAYGSNLNQAQMLARCPDAVPLKKATLLGARMIFKHYADVEIVKSKNLAVRQRNKVVGALYKISQRDLKALDRYEGYPDLYKRVRIHVIDDVGNVIEAFMYVMQPDYYDYSLPTKKYFQTIVDGFADWNLKDYYLFNSWENTALIVDPELAKVSK